MDVCERAQVARDLGEAEQNCLRGSNDLRGSNEVLYPPGYESYSL